MTLSVASTGHTVATAAKQNEWGKGASSDARGFDEALAGGTDKRRAAAGMDAEAEAPSTKSEWRMAQYRALLQLDPAGAQETGEFAIPQDDPTLLDDDAALAGTDDAEAADAAHGQADFDRLLTKDPAEPEDAIATVLRALARGDQAASEDAPVDGEEQKVETRDGRSVRNGSGRAEAEPRAPANAGADAATGRTAQAVSQAAVAETGQQGDPKQSHAAAGRPAAAQGQPAVDADAPDQRPQPVEAGRQAAVPDKAEPQGKDARTAGPADALAARVSVLGVNNALAPAPTAAPLLSTTVAGFVSAIEGDASWRQAAAENALAAGQRGPSSFSAVNSLRIQLQPVELGMVTARLTANGSQLSIEIQVESNDARQKLANDSEIILKALRSVGYDVEKVTIQQQSQNAQPGAQTTGGSGREHFAADQQQRGDANGRSQGGQDAGREGRGSGHGPGEMASERSRSDVYI